MRNCESAWTCLEVGPHDDKIVYGFHADWEYLRQREEPADKSAGDEENDTGLVRQRQGRTETCPSCVIASLLYLIMLSWQCKSCLTGIQ